MSLYKYKRTFMLIFIAIIIIFNLLQLPILFVTNKIVPLYFSLKSYAIIVQNKKNFKDTLFSLFSWLIQVLWHSWVVCLCSSHSDSTNSSLATMFVSILALGRLYTLSQILALFRKYSSASIFPPLGKFFIMQGN